MLEDIDNAPWETIPAHCRTGLRRYIVDRILPGNFLCAVLENDLKMAVAYADDENVQALPAYVRFLTGYVPSTCWGTKERVRDWTAARIAQAV